MKKIWKNIIGYNDRYLICSDGRCKALPYTNLNGWEIKEKILKPSFNEDGYLRYALFFLDENGSRFRKNAFLHRLVAQAFIPNPGNLPQINHINGIKTDNRIENLEWIDNSGNQLHAFKFLNKKRGIGEKNPNFISKIGAFDKNGFQVELFDGSLDMKNKGYNYSCIYSCLTGKQKTHKNLTFKRL